MSANNTTPSSQPTCICDLSINTYTYVSNVAAVVVNVLLSIFAVVCNALVMLAVYKTKSLHRPANLLICSLALTDFLVGLVVQPITVVRLLMHNAGVSCCLYNDVTNAYALVTPLFACGSFVQVCVMCWDRYKAVSSPFEHRATVTNKRMMHITATSWCAWLIYIAMVKIVPYRAIRGPLASLALGTFVIVPLVFQIKTLKVMRRHNNQIAAAVSSATTIAREKKMVVTLRYILASVFGSVLPQFGFSIVAAISGDASLSQALPSPWTKITLCLSSCLNPLIYFWRHPDMRNAALRLIGR